MSYMSNQTLNPVTFRFDEKTLNAIDRLAHRLAKKVGLVRPLSRSDVLRAAVNRLESEEFGNPAKRD